MSVDREAPEKLPEPSTGILKGGKFLLLGPSGTGKTFSFSTAVDWAEKNNTRVLALFTENGLETLIGAYTEAGKPIPKCLSWHTVDMKPTKIEGLLQAAKDVGRLNYDMLAKIQDPNRAKNNVYYEVLTQLSDFQDQRTGEARGNIEDWGTDTILIIDSLTELSNACMKMQIGSKPTASMPDYLVAQTNLMSLLRYLTNGVRCHLILTAHPTREKDEITGGVKLMPKTIGSAIAGEIAPLFSEVILTVREADKFFWDTASSSADLKSRYLPISSKNAPTFQTLFSKWFQRNTAS